MRGKVLVVHSDDISESEFIDKNQSFINAAKQCDITLEFRSNYQVYTYIDNHSTKCHDSFDTFNYAIFFDHDVCLARNLEMLGLRVVNNSNAIEICGNKARMYQVLAKNRIAIAKTVVFPTLKQFSNSKMQSFTTEACNDLGLPIVVKEWYGNSGKNVYLCKNKQELNNLVSEKQGKSLLFQEYVLESSGSDIRMFVIGNKVVASIRRQGMSGDFRSNLSLGGIQYKYLPTYIEEELAINATKAMGCDFAIVDILKSINGPVVCEVNTTANVNNFIKTCGIDIPTLLFKSIK